MLYPNVFFISSLETFTTLSSYHADHIGQWVINVVLKQRQSQKKLLKSEYKMAVFLRGESLSILFMIHFSILTILNPPRENHYQVHS